MSTTCPECGSKDVETGECDWNGARGVWVRRCRSCGYEPASTIRPQNALLQQLMWGPHTLVTLRLTDADRTPSTNVPKPTADAIERDRRAAEARVRRAAFKVVCGSDSGNRA